MASRPRGRPRKVQSFCSFPSHFLSLSLSLSHSLSLMFSSLKLNSWTQTQSHIVLLKTKNCLFPMLFSVIFSHTWFCRKIHVWLQLLTPCAPMDFLRIWSNSPWESYSMWVSFCFSFSMFQCVFESKKQ